MFVHVGSSHHFSLPPRPDSPSFIAGSPRPALRRNQSSSSSFTLIPAVTRFAMEETAVIPDEFVRSEDVSVVAAAASSAGVGVGACANSAVAPSKSGDPRAHTNAANSLPSTNQPPNSNNSALNQKQYKHTPSFSKPLPASALKNRTPLATVSSSVSGMTSHSTASEESRPSSNQTTRPPTSPSLSSGSPPSPPMPSLLARRRSSASAKRPNLFSLTCSAPPSSDSTPALKIDNFPTSIPLPLPLPAPLADLDDTVRPAVIGLAAAALTPASESASPQQLVVEPLGVSSFLPTKKFVSTPYPEKKQWLEDEEDEDEVDSLKGQKYVASDEESSEEEDDYFESEKDKLAREAQQPANEVASS